METQASNLTSNNFSFNVKLKNNIVIENVDLGIKINDGRAIGKNSIVKEDYIKTKNETRNIHVPNKDRKIISKYNELNLKLNKCL